MAAANIARRRCFGPDIYGPTPPVEGIMQLIKKYLEPGAVGSFIQLGHRRDAVDSVIAAIGQIYKDNPHTQNPDPLTWDAGVMEDWLVESLLQGAYIREYHLWEKECKAYFAAVAKRNGGQMILTTQGFIKQVKDALVAFGVAVPDATLGAIDHMRERVNVMKHEPGLEEDHFISDGDYIEAIDAIESFWGVLAGCERVTC
jgi:hypothetical protein